MSAALQDAAPAEAPRALRELIEAVGALPLQPLLAELDRELAQVFDAPPPAAAELAEQAHALVGAAGGLGFLDLAGLCREVELACRAGRDWRTPLAHARAEARAARATIERMAAG